MNSLRASTIVAVICLTVAGTMTMAGDGFQWSDLNPFRSAKPSTTSSPPPRTTQRTAPPAKPSRLSTWSRNTRTSIVKTTRWLNPFDGPAQPAPAPSLTGSRRVTRSTKPEEPKGNWFTRMFTREEPEEPRSASLSDWIGGERPNY